MGGHVGGNNYVGVFVDDCPRFNVVKFVEKKSHTTTTFLSLHADYNIPQELSVKCI